MPIAKHMVIFIYAWTIQSQTIKSISYFT